MGVHTTLESYNCAATYDQSSITTHICYVSRTRLPILSQYSAVFVPATPNDGRLPQSSALHFLLQTSTIPSGACCAEYSTVFVPATPNDGCLPQPSVLHFLLQTSTMPSGACCAQYSAVFVPATPNDGRLSQPSALNFLLQSTTPSSA